VADVSRAVAIIFTADTSAAQAAVRQMADALANIGASGSGAKDLSKSIDDVGASAQRAATNLDFFANIVKAAFVQKLVQEFIDANVAVQNFDRAMTVIRGTSVAAGDDLEYVRKISETLGLELTSTAKSFIQISAASQGTVLEGQKTRDIFEAIVKAMSLLGKSSAETEGALLAVQQMISKGTVQSEELRGQLGERLPGAFQLAARAIGVTTAELQGLLKDGKVVATEFLPLLANELNRTFGDTKYVETYNASLNRLTNSFKEFAISVGEAGVFNLLTSALNGATSATKLFSTEFQIFVDIYTAYENMYRRGTVRGFANDMKLAIAPVLELRLEFDKENESVAENERLTRKAAEAGEYFNFNSVETTKLLRQQQEALNELGADATKAQELLAKLGVDPKKIKDPLFDAQQAFSDLVNTGQSAGNELFAAFSNALKAAKTIEDINLVGAALTEAYRTGQIGVELFTLGVKELGNQQDKVTKVTGTTAKALADQTKELDKSKEAAAKLALELEKIASNERIKTLEFKANIDVAKIKADAEKVQAAFASINVGIESTGDLLGKLFGMFDKLGSLDSSAYRAVFDQIDKENVLREKSFTLQEKLTQAQIDNLNAQTKALAGGDAIIKIDGAGLQPHLEAFMWEILKAVQVRANRDGLAFLLGV
jgi:tape measure domain-containing protein